jgi:hypothetical protein
MNYYYAKNGDTHGPVSLEDLRRMWGEGEVTPDIPICPENAETWAPLSSIAQPFIVEPATVPPRQREYAVVPFVAVIDHNKGSTEAAGQLQVLIQTYARSGWEYVRLEHVETYIAANSGCFGLGASPARSTVYSMAVFKK